MKNMTSGVDPLVPSSMTTEILLDGLAFPECPRWHAGALWFSDQHGGAVWRMEPSGTAEKVLEVPGHPGGIDWGPDGDLLVVSMEDRLLLKFDGRRTVSIADMSRWHPGLSNDLVVSAEGVAYVGNIGFDYYARKEPRSTVLTAVSPTGEVSVAAEDVFVPNGMVLTPDGSTLILAESLGHRLTAFDVASDGTLSRRRIFADLVDAVPDGICLDREGGVWCAIPSRGQVVRVLEGGLVTDRVSTGNRAAVATVLGGADGRTLYVCTTEDFFPPETLEKRTGRIEKVQVRVPRAGLS